MMDSFENEQASARRALALLEAAFAQLREMSYEGIGDVTVRTRTQTLVLVPSAEALGVVAQALTDDLFRHHGRVQQEVSDLAQSVADEQQQVRQRTNPSAQ